MLLFFSSTLCSNDYTSCFEVSEILKGDKATQRLYIILKPQKTLTQFCKAVDNQNATIELFVDQVEKNLIPNSTQILLNMSSDSIEFMVQLQNTNYSNGTNLSAVDLYEQISNKKYASYTIHCLSSELQGGIQEMLFNTLDATNCWSSCVMNYDVNSSESYIHLITVPNDCNISQQVAVTIEYAIAGSNSWTSFKLQPYKNNSSHPVNPNNNETYTNNSSFNHKTNVNFIQYYNDYNGTNDEETKQLKDAYMKFINTFLLNRNIQVKLVVEETQTAIKQAYYTYVNNFTGTDQDCYKKYYLYQSRTDLALFVSGRTHCKAVNQGTKMNATVFLKQENGQVYQQIKQVRNTLFEKATLLRFDLENEWPINSTPINYTVYLTIYNETADGSAFLATEITYPGVLTKSCFQQMLIILRKYDVCLDIYLVQMVSGTQLFDNNISNGDDLKCILRFNSIDYPQKLTTYWDIEPFIISTRTYTMYTTFNVTKFSSFHNRFCFKETEPPVVEILPGSIYKRNLIMIQKLHEFGKGQASGIYINDIGAYYVDDIIYEANTLMYIWAFVPGVVALGGIGLFLYIQYKQNK